jgi:hypothetical protein
MLSLLLTPSIPILHRLLLHPVISPLPYLPFNSLFSQYTALRIPIPSEQITKVAGRITDMDFPIFQGKVYLSSNAFFSSFYNDISSLSSKTSHFLLTHKEFTGAHLFEMEFESQFPLDDLHNGNDDVWQIFYI